MQLISSNSCYTSEITTEISNCQEETEQPKSKTNEDDNGSGLFSPVDTNVFVTRRPAAPVRYSRSTKDAFPASIMIQGKHVDLTSSQRHCRMFFEESGMIGFAPEGVQVGDLVCQFKGSDIAAILRKSPELNRFQIIGRTAGAYSTGPPYSPFRSHEIPGCDSYQQIPARLVLLHLDISTLQLLTKRYRRPERQTTS